MDLSNCGVDGQTSGDVVSDGGATTPGSLGSCIEDRVYTFMITDDCGNTQTATATVSRHYDVEKPSITPPADYTLAECNAPWPASLTGGFTDNCGVDGLTSGDVVSDGGATTPGSLGSCIEDRVYTFMITDDCGNTQTATATVSRHYDVEKPSITPPADYTLAECNAPWPASLTGGFTDNCGVDGQTSGDVVSDGGATTPGSLGSCIEDRVYTFMITDDCGNTQTATATVSRHYDVEKPSITPPADYTLAESNPHGRQV